MLASPTFARLKVVQSDRTLYTAFETPLSGALADPATPVTDLSKTA
jgi:iron complex transport system substrate-binding protein